MKVLLEKYPKGSMPYQKSDGRYIDENIYSNLKVMAEKIVQDMTFLGVAYSSTLEVGTGKSVLLSQIGEVWTELVNQIHGTNLTFTGENIVFRPKDLIERSFKLPKYSCILLDEWDDSHYWSELGMTLRKFFRKCRQLNLFILIIIPNFFQLPISYAISRSAFAIDVKFEGAFERGYFQFYNFNKKKDLYIKGKKTYNYNVVQPNFTGRFADGYGIPEDEYRKRKHEDLVKFEDEKDKKLSITDIKSQEFKKMHKLFGDKMTNKQWAEVYEVSDRTIMRWKQREDKSIKDYEDTGSEDN